MARSNRVLSYGARRGQILRTKVLDRLGPSCKHCGFSDVRALQIDHIHGGGIKDIRSSSNIQRYTRILKMPEPNTFYQILCANCNWIKRHENNETGSQTVNPTHLAFEDQTAGEGQNGKGRRGKSTKISRRVQLLRKGLYGELTVEETVEFEKLNSKRLLRRPRRKDLQ
jgi:predicted nucleic-acid-binding Zn-ribbon protein